MTERITLSLINPVQAHQALSTAWRHAKAWLMAGHRLTLEVRPEKRSDAQNRLLHACLSEISKRVEWAGAKRDVVAFVLRRQRRWCSAGKDQGVRRVAARFFVALNGTFGAALYLPAMNGGVSREF